MWEKSRSFIIKAGTVILLACLTLLFLQSFSFRLELLGGTIEDSMLAKIGGILRCVFVPLGFGDLWAPAVASITGILAKEIVVAVVGALIARIQQRQKYKKVV